MRPLLPFSKPTQPLFLSLSPITLLSPLLSLFLLFSPILAAQSPFPLTPGPGTVVSYQDLAWSQAFSGETSGQLPLHGTLGMQPLRTQAPPQWENCSVQWTFKD